MITKLLNEVNEKIETLNNLVQDKEYFEKLDERIEKVNNYVQKQEQETERLKSIIKEVREYIEKRKDTQKWRKESLKEKSTNIDIVLEHYRDILQILDKENKDGER